MHDMSVVSTVSAPKSWKERGEVPTVLHDMAVTKERVRDQLLGLRKLYGTPDREMTQEAAAQKVGTSARNWQRWENMEVKPGPDSLSEIAEAFDISLDVFDDGKPDRSSTPLAVRLDELDERLDRLLAVVTDDVLPALSQLEERVAEVAEGSRRSRAGGSKSRARPAT